MERLGVVKRSIYATSLAGVALFALSSCSEASEPEPRPITQHSLDCESNPQGSLDIYVDPNGRQPFQHHVVDVSSAVGVTQLEVRLPNLDGTTVVSVREPGKEIVHLSPEEAPHRINGVATVEAQWSESNIATGAVVACLSSKGAQPE